MSEIEKKVKQEMNDDLIPGETEKRENFYKPKYQPYEQDMFDGYYDKPYKPYTPPPARPVITGFQKRAQEQFNRIDALYEQSPPIGHGAGNEEYAEVTSRFVQIVSQVLFEVVGEYLDGANMIIKTQSCEPFKQMLEDFLVHDCWIANKSGKYYKEIEVIDALTGEII